MGSSECRGRVVGMSDRLLPCLVLMVTRRGSAWSCSPSLNAGTWVVDITSSRVVIQAPGMKLQWELSCEYLACHFLGLVSLAIVSPHQGLSTLGSHVKMNCVCFCSLWASCLCLISIIFASVFFSSLFPTVCNSPENTHFPQKSPLSNKLSFLRDKRENYAHNLFSFYQNKNFPCRSISKVCYYKVLMK